MSTAQIGVAAEPVEAVIISGPRKGEIVRLNSDEIVLTAEEERALDALQAQLDQTVQVAKAAVAELSAAREEYRRGE